jgi:hypothetical protein
VPGRSVEQTQPPATPCRCLPNQVAPCMLDATCALPSRPKRTSAHPRPFVQSRNLVRRTTSGISWPGAIGQIGWPMTARRRFQAKAKAADAVSLAWPADDARGGRESGPREGSLPLKHARMMSAWAVSETYVSSLAQTSSRTLLTRCSQCSLLSCWSDRQSVSSSGMLSGKTRPGNWACATDLARR